jgi:23S rRNA pseudouridine2604 synthase
LGFTRKIKYCLVHTLNISNTDAQRLLDSGQISYRGQIVSDNVTVDDVSEIKVGENILRPEKKLVCFKFYKPRGFESTLNKNVEHNIASFFPEIDGLAIAGRLDKDSEGLLLVSNDGKWIQEICDPRSKKEKEYIVELGREPDNVFLASFSEGVMLGDGMTRPCSCERIQHKKIRVILTEGRNRQIRRMCHKLGYKVLSLNRIRVDNIYLDGNMKPSDLVAIIRFGKF